MPAPRIFAKRNEEDPASRAPAVVLAFPARAPIGPRDTAKTNEAGTGPLPYAPELGERPTLPAPKFREWLRATLIASLVLHVMIVVAMQLRFDDDLERAKGAAAALSEGTITIPIEVVVESALPSAPSPTNASASDARAPSDEPQKELLAEKMQAKPQEISLEGLLPPPPKPAPVILPTARSRLQMPQPPAPAPVVLPTREEARLALPEEESSPPVPAETADAPQGPSEPATTLVLENKPPLPVARPPVPQKAQERPQEQKASPPSAPSTAAAPSRAAAANSKGSSGAGGTLDAGGRAAVSSYFARVQAHLLRHRRYPPEAQSTGVTGTARVIFSLAPDGRVLSLSLAGSSGQSVLDRAALDMVRRATPFPPFPPEIRASRLEMGAPVRFDLR